jgi:sortase A
MTIYTSGWKNREGTGESSPDAPPEPEAPAAEETAPAPATAAGPPGVYVSSSYQSNGHTASTPPPAPRFPIMGQPPAGSDFIGQPPWVPAAAPPAPPSVDTRAAPDRDALSRAVVSFVTPWVVDRPRPSSKPASRDQTALLRRVDVPKPAELTTYLNLDPLRRKDSTLPIRRHRKLFDREHWIRSTVRTTGETMVTLGLVLLLFAAYEVWGKAIIVNDHQRDLDSQLSQEWDNQRDNPVVSPSGGPGPAGAPLPAPPGGSIARLYIPRLGKHWVVVEGVTPNDIKYAPGHYPDTALPGQVGNFSVAGHRSPAIFWDLDQMQTDDKIVVETRTTYFVYTTTSREIVVPTALPVVAPVPDHPGAKATTPFLTLTTCNPKWDNFQRLIVHATLERQQPRSDGLPAEANGA